ncbi:MetQ/NlpA family ABC transporter substrate-binding protein [Gorillibacterium sp. sgz500922]|uniref:MetQ/NlpA family ABC transporter substrate-binding protein n=1 Tax=Gorillibacterium sp. sgz500922 TaxID=3446694 RepID=UPI003F676053
MKKWLTVAASLVLAVSLGACGKSEDTLKVGATAVPHAEILEHLKPILAKEGVKLEVKVFNDYVLPNTQVAEKQLDANFFQHIPYLEQQNKERGLKLVEVTGVHIEPIGLYSRKVTKLDELKDGATIAVPNDPSNFSRALLLIAKAGLIQLKDGVGYSATEKDITQNAKNLTFKPLDAAMIPRSLDEVDAAVINTNYALAANLSPTKDALVLEDKDSPYVNILVSREDNKDSEALQKLAKALNSDEVKKFIQEKYGEAIVPAF